MNIEAGTQVEMVLQSPLQLTAANLAPASAPPPLATAVNQPKPLDKPHRGKLLGPSGRLGCE